MLWGTDAHASPEEKVIVDFNPGSFIDDLLMLSLVMESEELDVLAVTTTHNPYGKDPLAELKITKKFLHECGYEVPVAQGITWSQKYNLANFFMVNYLEGWAKDYMIDEGENIGALSLLKDVLEENDGVTILVTGPLTNIGALIKHYPVLSKERIKRIVIMGGSLSYGVGHIVMQIAEYNISMDIEAAQTVFGSEIPITLVPLDAASDLIMRKDAYMSMSSGSRMARLLFELNEIIKSEMWIGVGYNLTIMFDPFAAATIIEPDIGYYENLPIVVDDTGFTRIQEGGHLSRVYLLPDKEAFWKLLEERVINPDYDVSTPRTDLSGVGRVRET
jgi:inosine-uridine nucleoside N-ribohydrolase